MKHKLYYYSVVHTGDPCDPPADFDRTFHAKWECPECSQLLKDPGPVNLVIAHPPHNTPLNFARRVGKFMRRDFFEAIGNDIMQSYFSLSRVLSISGESYSDFIGYRGKATIRSRGDKTSFYKKCTHCGMPRYFPLGKRYLLRSSLTDAPIYDGDIDALIVNEEIYLRLRKGNWKKIGFQRLLVLDEPLDGLPMLLA